MSGKVVHSRLPHVLFRMKENLFAVSCADVKEILILPNVERVSGLPSHFRGIVNIRGTVMKVIDLRVLLGMISARDEMESLCDLLEKREADHRRWIAELMCSIKEKRDFTLARDPHKCAFGKWYDAFTTDDRLLSAQLRKFDEPHKRIHALADHVLGIAAAGNIDEALELVQHAENNELAELIGYFMVTRQLIRDRYRDIGLVVLVAGQHAALSVDSVESIEMIEEHESGSAMVTEMTDVVSGVAMRKNQSEPVMLIQPSKLFFEA